MLAGAGRRLLTGRLELAFAADADRRTYLERQYAGYPFHVCRALYQDRDRPGLATIYVQSCSGGVYEDDRLDVTLGARRGRGSACLDARPDRRPHHAVGTRKPQRAHRLRERIVSRISARPANSLSAFALQVKDRGQARRRRGCARLRRLPQSRSRRARRDVFRLCERDRDRECGGEALAIDRLRLDGRRSAMLVREFPGLTPRKER